MFREVDQEEDQNLITKGIKRNYKSQKLQMLISQNPNFGEVIPNSDELNVVGDQYCHNFSNLSSSPSSNGRDGNEDEDENEHKHEDEDEYMANCLILLAQGPPANSQPSSSSLGKFNGALQGQNGAGKAERCCVYECKTCSRTFPSFQALGGHRSSHKNAATAADGDRNPISVTSPANKQQQQQQSNNGISSPIDRLRLSRSDYYNGKFKLVNNNNKVHQCAICGAEFMSGQALGGHMRRHRRGSGGASEDSGEIDRRRRPYKKQRSNLLCLDLDLNLPAPEDDTRDQSGVVQIAAAPLVGCHY